MLVFWIFAGLSAMGLAAFVLQILAVRAHTSSPDSGEGDAPPHSFPPVSVLKPLKGLDDNLFDNLESFCNQDYPEYEVIFALRDPNDPAYKIARKIKGKYPDKNIVVVVDRCDDGLNPKVNNLITAYRIAGHDHILISDSNVMVGPDYLKEIVRSVSRPGVGLVSSLIKGAGGRTIGSVFENLHMNSFIIGSVCFLDRFLAMPCVVGKSMLMRKQDLEVIGGLGAFKDVLAEDYLIGKMMKESGKKVVLSDYLIHNVNQYGDIRKFIGRHTRWGKLRWRIGGAKYLSEIAGNAVFVSVLPLMFLEPSKTTVSYALLVGLLKALGDFYIGRRIASDMNPFLYLLAPVKDVLIGLLWFVPIFSSTVVWRGNRYLIGRDSVLSPYPDSGRWTWKYRLMDAIRR